MKNFTLLFSFIVISLSSFAQQFNVSLSNEAKFEPNDLAYFHNSFYSFEQKNNKMQMGWTFKLNKLKFSLKLQKLNKEMGLIKEFEPEKAARAYGPIKPKFAILNDKLYLFYFTYDTENGDGSIRISSAVIDTTSLELTDIKEVLTISQDNVGLFKGADLLIKYNFTIQQSPDESKTMLFFSPGTDMFYISVLDTTMHKIWKKDYSLLQEETRIDYQSTCIDNSGTVYIGSKFSPYKGEAQSQVIVCRQNAKQKMIPFSAKEFAGFPGSVYVLASQDSGKVYVVGTYAESRETSLTGVFKSTINLATLKLVKAVQTPFTSTLVDQLSDDGWASKKKNRGLANIGFSVYEYENNKIAMAGEFARTQTGEKTTFDIRGSILAVEFNDDSASFYRIPKARVSAGSTYGASFHCITYNNAMVIFYNDYDSHLKTEIEKSAQRSDVYKDVSLIAATINKDGTVKRQNIMDLSKKNFTASTSYILRTSENVVMIPFFRVGGLGGVKDEIIWSTIRMN